MAEYTELIKALRHCSEDDDACATCQRWIAHDEWGIKCKGRLISDAAAAIEELQQIADHYEQTAKDYWKEACEYKAQLPKRGEWNNHEVACLLAEMFGDNCACNLNGIDEWLPKYCEFAETCCPNPVGVACWEQFLKHRAKMEVQE